MAVAITIARAGVDGATGLVALIIVSACGGLVYAALVWVLDIAHLRTSMAALLRLRAAE
jgi:hypothetical protein